MGYIRGNKSEYLLRLIRGKDLKSFSSVVMKRFRNEVDLHMFLLENLAGSQVLAVRVDAQKGR